MAGRVYFIQEGPDGAIKIGWTTKEMDRRVHSLQIGNPRKIRALAVIDGVEKSLEAEWHARFAHCRIRGEWFFPLPELLRAINGAAAFAAPKARRFAPLSSGTALNDWMNKCAVSQKEMAARLGITQSTMSQISTGARKLGIGMATRIELATGGDVKVTDLMNNLTTKGRAAASV